MTNSIQKNRRNIRSICLNDLTWMNQSTVSRQTTAKTQQKITLILNKCIQIQNTSKSSPKSFQTGLDFFNNLFILIVYTVQLGMKFTRIQSQAKLTETYFCIQAQQKHEQIESSNVSPYFPFKNENAQSQKIICRKKPDPLTRC